MVEQLTFKTMGGDTVTVPKRGKHYIQPKGYAARPGGGPDGETCKTCQHYTRRRFNGRPYPKCALTERAWTNSRGSDILASAPACQLWEADDDG